MESPLTILGILDPTVTRGHQVGHALGLRTSVRPADGLWWSREPDRELLEALAVSLPIAKNRAHSTEEPSRTFRYAAYLASLLKHASFEAELVVGFYRRKDPVTPDDVRRDHAWVAVVDSHGLVLVDPSSAHVSSTPEAGRYEAIDRIRTP